MMRCAVAISLVVLGAAVAHTDTKQGHRAFLASDGGESMRPDVVAKTLMRVEEEWSAQAVTFTEGNSTEAKKTAFDSFSHSCATVVAAIVQGSSGDRDAVKTYMANVCGQKVLVDRQKLRCNDLAKAVAEKGMQADKYANRMTLQPSKVCNAFWSKFVEEEKKREEIEAKERAEQEKLRAEQEKQAAIAAAEAKKKAEAEAEEQKKKKAEEEKKKKEEEEARRVQEEQREKAKKAAAEAKERAAAAAARLAQKKAEAEKIQQEAQKKLEEAAKAEKEHQARLAEHEKAAELLRNASVQANSSEPSVNSTVVTNETSSKLVEPVVTNSTEGAALAKATAVPKAAKSASKF